MTDSNCSNKQPKIFPKLFIGDAVKSFITYMNKNNYNYPINYIYSKEDLIDLIDRFSYYANYNQPVIISDISYLNKQGQSLLLKFIDDSKLKIILLASRDNILNTVISRVREYRKFYYSDPNKTISFINPNRAREMFNNDHKDDLEDTSTLDKQMIMCNYNPILVYDDYLVSKYNNSNREKLLSILEYTHE